MGKLTDDLKLKIYPAIIGVLGLCLIASLFSRYEITVWRETVPPEAASPELNSPETRSPTAERSPNPALPSPTTSSSPDGASERPQPTPNSANPANTSSQSPSGTSQQGTLRVSNRTEYPIRVALLPLQPGTSFAQTASEDASAIAYTQPVHWDFAPSEGKLKGLKLSLPDGTLKVQVGDIIVAFAQDGSRRYWGPYVIGKTQLPAWDAATQEWQLNLQP